MPANEISLEDFNKYIFIIKGIVKSFPKHHREDLIQEGILGLHKAYMAFKEEKGIPFEQFTKLCIKRQIYTAYKKLKKDDDVVLLDEQDDIIYNDCSLMEDVVISKNHTDELFKNLKDILTPLEYNILECYLLDESYEQIANKLNVKEKSVDNTITRIKNKIKKIYLP
jgi:RNA polymerase sporulation-specific sigma factor